MNGSAIVDQILLATGSVLWRAAGEETPLAAPHRFRHLVPTVERGPSTRRFREIAVSSEDLQATLRAAFECDANGHCSLPSAGNLQGIEAVAFPSTGNAVTAVTPGRDWQPKLLDAQALSRALFGQFQGEYWAVLLFVDPAPYVERYGTRALRHIFIEAGLVSARLGTLAAAAGLGGCIVGGFDDLYFRKLLSQHSSALVPVSIYSLGGVH